MAEHNVYCVKLKKELLGLDEPPFDTAGPESLRKCLPGSMEGMDGILQDAAERISP